jgi:methylornithine synthase
MTISLDTILEKAIREQPLHRGEIMYLLRLKEVDELKELFEVARNLRNRYFGDRIFFYGFIYFSTWCRNDCTFCFYRRSNRFCIRYRKTDDQVLEASAHLAESGVHLLDLTMGEDPFYFSRGNGFDPLLGLVEKVKSKTHLPIMISWGPTPDEVLKELPQAGADWFACYQETHNRGLFERLRVHQDYHRRFEVKQKAVNAGMLIEEGILSGVGESLEDIANSIETMKRMNLHQARVMNFVPQKGTPMANFPGPHPSREEIIIAVLRILLPHRLIPASLDVNGIDGLKGKLQAGANVVTSLILPSSELRGVAQSELGISEGQRTVKTITPILDELGLKKASLEDYTNWMNEEKRSLSRNVSSVGDCSIGSGYCWGKVARG